MKRDFAALQGEFDLLVCGGGIYGAWTAYDAALRGLKVALVEQGDWASATSSASSKLIHGGLRYLETYDFKLVRKALKERQMLLQAAPHRVWPLRFGVPVYTDSRNGMLKLKAGLTLYDMLAGFPEEQMRYRHLDHAHFSRHFPFLDERALQGGFTYGDAQTDDARLVLELVAGAMAHGAVCANYARLVAWNEEGGQVCGATVRDAVTNATVQVRARQCVSTAGQWAAATAQGREWCRLSKGIHLVMPALPTNGHCVITAPDDETCYDRFPHPNPLPQAGEGANASPCDFQVNEAILLTAKSDGRVFFIIPWCGRTLLGTTDTDYRGDIGRVVVEADEIDYLLAAANRYLKTAWTKQDVIGSYAGLRVMKQSDAAHPSAASRDWELKTAANGLHHAIGGKLTSAREDATVIVDAVCAQLGVAAPCATRDRDFPWKPAQDFAVWSEEAGAQAQRLGIDAESAKWLARRHGVRIAQVFRIVEETPQLAARIVAELPFIHADLLLCARDEMALHMSDLLRRRMPLLILARLDPAEVRRLAELVAPEMGWDADRIAQEVEACFP
jgi:glycerol-3-phosphate dehydrogenase